MFVQIKGWYVLGTFVLRGFVGNCAVTEKDFKEVFGLPGQQGWLFKNEETGDLFKISSLKDTLRVFASPDTEMRSFFDWIEASLTDWNG